ncbi:valine--tRNA ligase, variant 2 [Balamuthia mandrillaris]
MMRRGGRTRSTLVLCLPSSSSSYSSLRSPLPLFFHRRKATTTASEQASRPPLGSLAAAYDPVAVESKGWHQWYEARGSFHANNDPRGDGRPVFSMVIPPPNVTGSLHLGHTLTNSIQDALVRWRRMKGDNTLYLPGLDHAGIATQTVVEKKLMREQGKTRHDLGRERFLEEVWRWKEASGGRICQQLKRIGASLDWKREVFTMDSQRERAVTEAFVRLHEAGLLYRNTRLINWCCHLETVISDIEVDYEPVNKRTFLSLPGRKKKHEFGVIYRVAYPVEGGGELEVATTRPETILGDTAVAVHPNDPRYQMYHGRFVINPLTGRQLPIITDGQLVDMELGTGVVKVTPAHDENDYQCGLRHNLEQINILNDNGTLNGAAGDFQGMDRLDARNKVIEALEQKGLYRGKQEHEMRLALCSRSGDVLEPRLKPQWYVRIKSMAEEAARLVREGEMEIVPQFHKDEWFRWLNNSQDWCVSRQLWWGHRIPAYKLILDDNKKKDEERWVIARSAEDAEREAKEKFGLRAGSFRLQQDEDVLDTWFSSSLFPLSALGWPDKTLDLQKFYPLSVMETGADILFFWVARMAMMCTFLSEGNIPPFKEVMLHAMVRDAHGRKMSKSIGNVIDPIDVIEGVSLSQLEEKMLQGGSNSSIDEAEMKRARKALKTDFPKGIPQCGTDALRFTLIDYTQQGRNINLDVNRVVANRHFCNKMWNATKFVLMYLHDQSFDLSSSSPTFPSVLRLSRDISLETEGGLVDKWILARLEDLIQKCDSGLSSFDLSTATSALSAFFVDDFCDVFLEATKMYSNENNERERMKAVLLHCLDTYFKLLHPFMPFVSEELWQHLPILSSPSDAELKRSKPAALGECLYPSSSFSSPKEELEAAMKEVMGVVHAARSLRDAHSLRRSSFGLVLRTNDLQLKELFEEQKELICHLAKAGSLDVRLDGPEPHVCFFLVCLSFLSFLFSSILFYFSKTKGSCCSDIGPSHSIVCSIGHRRRKQRVRHKRNRETPQKEAKVGRGQTTNPTKNVIRVLCRKSS